MFIRYIKKIPTTQWLVIALALFAITTIVSLAWIEQEQRTPKDWWVVYFVDPHHNNENYDFVIENYTQEKDFTYTLLNVNVNSHSKPTLPSDSVIEEKEVIVQNGQKEIHRPSLESFSAGALTITVTHGADKRTIYTK